MMHYQTLAEVKKGQRTRAQVILQILSFEHPLYLLFFIKLLLLRHFFVRISALRAPSRDEWWENSNCFNYLLKKHHVVI